MSPTRMVLNVFLKREIVAEYQQRIPSNELLTQEQVALWAEEKFKLSKAPNQATVSRIVSSASALLVLSPHRFHICKYRHVLAHTFKNKPYEWIRNQNAKSLALFGTVRRSDVERLQSEANRILIPGAQLNLVLTSRWISWFYRRYNLKFRNFHGEAGSSYSAALVEALPQLKDLLSHYAEKDT